MAEQSSVRYTQSTKLPALERSMHPVTLGFADPVLERHYHDARLRSRFVAGRMSALAGASAHDCGTQAGRRSPIADTYAQASLLFADVVGFTPLSSRFSSKQVVTMLNDLYERFDAIVARFGLEKIKTIGDCYMVAGGLPRPDSNHLERLTSAGIEMQAEAGKVRTPEGQPLALRIGMHTGPVTAGVIGQAKFAFDVWGDTVNMASRMEAVGTANRITVSDEVRHALGDAYAFSGPEMVELKGKGPTKVWMIEPAS